MDDKEKYLIPLLFLEIVANFIYIFVIFGLFSGFPVPWIFSKACWGNVADRCIFFADNQLIFFEEWTGGSLLLSCSVTGLAVFRRDTFAVCRKR